MSNSWRGAATTPKLGKQDVSVGPEHKPAAAPRLQLSADGRKAAIGDVVTFVRFAPPDGGTEVPNGSGPVLSEETKRKAKGLWIETGVRKKPDGTFAKTWVPRKAIDCIITKASETNSSSSSKQATSARPKVPAVARVPGNNGPGSQNFAKRRGNAARRSCLSCV